MNKLLLITILLIIFTGCHENQQWMSKEKSTTRKSVLEMTTRSYTAGSSVFTEILPEGSEIGLFITYGNQDSLYKGASLYKNVKSKAVGSSKGSLKWKQTPQVFLRSNRPVMIYAYSPYKVQIPLDPTSIPIKVTLRHAKAEEQNIRIVPTYSPIREKEVEAIFTINGKTYKYIIPEGTCWNKGYKYSYKFYFDGKEIKFHDLVACIWIPKLNKK